MQTYSSPTIVIFDVYKTLVKTTTEAGRKVLRQPLGLRLSRLKPQALCLLRSRVVGLNIGALLITNIILGVPYYAYSIINGPQNPILIIKALHYVSRGLGLGFRRIAV